MSTHLTYIYVVTSVCKCLMKRGGTFALIFLSFLLFRSIDFSFGLQKIHKYINEVFPVASMNIYAHAYLPQTSENL